MKRSLAATCVALVTLATACSPPSANELVEQVMRQRNQYTATLQSWIEREDGSLYLDVLVLNNNAEGGLRTLTVLVEQLDADNDVLTTSRAVMDVAALTAGLGQNVGVVVPGAVAGVEGVILRIEARVEEDLWRDFPEFDAVRPRI